MPTPPKRDNAYYEQQLKSRHPAIHADFLAGKYPHLMAALLAAGIKKPRTRSQELKNAWSKASLAEKKDFLRWLKSQMPATHSAPNPDKVAVDRRLQSRAADRIGEIMARRGLKPGDVSSELGLRRNDQSIRMAVVRGTQLQPKVIEALECWLKANAHI